MALKLRADEDVRVPVASMPGLAEEALALSFLPRLAITHPCLVRVTDTAEHGTAGRGGGKGLGIAFWGVWGEEGGGFGRKHG